MIGWSNVAKRLRNNTNINSNSNEQLNENSNTSFTCSTTEEDLNTVLTSLASWNSGLNQYNKAENMIKIQKIKHFLQLRHIYINLYKIATKEIPRGYAKFGIKYKKEN